MSAIEGGEQNPFGYADEIWRRFNSPSKAGEFPRGTSCVLTGQAGTPAARSVLRLQFRLDGGQVVDARFRAYGCPTSIAVGGWIADWSIGKTPAELRGLKLAQIRTALEIPDDRAHCAVLGEDAVRIAVAQLEPASK